MAALDRPATSASARSPGRHDLEAGPDQRPVQTAERDHIADRAESDQVQPAAEIGLRPGPEPALLAQQAVQPDDHREDDADRGEIADRTGLVAPVRVDDRDGFRQRLLGDVMIDHDDVEPEVGRVRKWGEGGPPAVEGDDQPRARRLQPADRRHVGAVAFGQPVGYVGDHRAVDGPKIAGEQGGRCRAVDVVVAEEADGLAAGDGVGEAHDRPVEVVKMRGVGEQGLDLGRDERLRAIDADPAPGQDPTDQLGQAVAERERQSRIVRLEAPGSAADRPFDRDVLGREGFFNELGEQRSWSA